ncbi:MAG: hypothetical protein FJY55_00145, partial [Betaproteobacteria bacterium]|nr:hypothetical protein [Betaproteobacteria bacterium]
MDWATRINAALKARATRRLYDRTLTHYRRSGMHREAPAVPRLRQQRADALRIFFLGTDEQQDSSGMLQSLQKLGDARHFTRADGSYGQNDPRPEAVRRQANADRLWELVSTQAHAGHAPDILIGQTWATLI